MDTGSTPVISINGAALECFGFGSFSVVQYLLRCGFIFWCAERRGEWNFLESSM